MKYIYVPYPMLQIWCFFLKDETAVNCMRFIKEDGMAVFMKCLEVY